MELIDEPITICGNALEPALADICLTTVEDYILRDDDTLSAFENCKHLTQSGQECERVYLFKDKWNYAVFVSELHDDYGTLDVFVGQDNMPNILIDRMVNFLNAVQLPDSVSFCFETPTELLEKITPLIRDSKYNLNLGSDVSVQKLHLTNSPFSIALSLQIS